MIFRASALAWLLSAGAALACPPVSETLLMHSCWGQARAEIVLLPEQADSVTRAPAASLSVTGAYTGTEPRANGAPNPVGLFVHGGRVINPNLARMDGVLVIDPEHGVPEIYPRTTVRTKGGAVDLTDPEARAAFAADAAARGLSVLQSHLLIVDGTLDVRPVEDAPTAKRRFLILDEHGYGIAQTAGSETLYQAGLWVAETYEPRMALNLDMGSYDYCLLQMKDGQEICGVLGVTETQRLSNLLRLVLGPDE